MKKKIIQMLGGFLALMILFTLLSRAADSAGIPRVTTTTIQSLSIVHKVTAQGKVEENREQAVTTEANQRVKAIYVNEGQQVEEGELLFEIDMEELREQILNMEQEIEKQKLQTQDSLSSKAVEAERKALEQQRASSDYADAQSQGDRATCIVCISSECMSRFLGLDVLDGLFLLFFGGLTTCHNSSS